MRKSGLLLIAYLVLFPFSGWALEKQSPPQKDDLWTDSISTSLSGPSKAPEPEPEPSEKATDSPQATLPPPDLTAKPAKPPTKNLRFSPSLELLTGKPFSTTAIAGLGMNGAYEFHITPSFFVGLLLAARYYPAQTWLAQLGYGVTLRHAFLAPDSMFRPYFAYGLLMQVTWVQGQPGSGLAHDTRLAIGVDSKWLGMPLFLELAYDISRLRYFGNAEENLDRFEVQLGWQYSW